MNSQEKWINDIESVSSEMKQVDPSLDLMNRLKNIPNQFAVVKMVPLKVVWTVAASVAILVCANLYSLNQYQNTSNESTSEVESLETSYFSYMKQM